MPLNDEVLGGGHMQRDLWLFPVSECAKRFVLVSGERFLVVCGCSTSDLQCCGGCLRIEVFPRYVWLFCLLSFALVRFCKSD